MGVRCEPVSVTLRSACGSGGSGKRGSHAGGVASRAGLAAKTKRSGTRQEKAPLPAHRQIPGDALELPEEGRAALFAAVPNEAVRLAPPCDRI